MLAAAITDRYRRQVAAALRAVDARPPCAYVWFGRRTEVLTPRERARVGEARRRELLVDAIARRLERDFHGAGVPLPPPLGPAPAGDGDGFVRALSQANCGRGQWQAGWRVVGHGPDETTVQRPDGLRLRVAADDARLVAETDAGAPPAVRVPKEAAGLTPGLYVALGDAPLRADGDAALTRLSWNVAAAGAVTLVARATYVLNRAELPFGLELATDPARYRDASAADLLVRTEDFAAVASLLRPLLRALRAQLADPAPAFAKPLSRGIAVAEEPAGGRRFGEQRCRLLAEAVLAARERRLDEPARRLALVERRFADAGLTLDAPYLRPGSRDAYELS